MIEAFSRRMASEAPKTQRDKILETVKTVGLAVAIALGVRVGIAQAYQVDGPSMEPSLVQDQRLLVLRAAYGLSIPWVSEAVAMWGTPSVGDVVIIESPADGLDLVKRVVGVEGDRIEIREGVLYRNGREVAHRDLGSCDPGRHIEVDAGCRVIEERIGDRRWTTSRADLGFGSDIEEVRVPAGQVYLLGDHRDRSNDSRSFGPVPVNRLRGRVLLID
jgi:signal peptidase I